MKKLLLLLFFIPNLVWAGGGYNPCDSEGTAENSEYCNKKIFVDSNRFDEATGMAYVGQYDHIPIDAHEIIRSSFKNINECEESTPNGTATVTREEVDYETKFTSELFLPNKKGVSNKILDARIKEDKLVISSSQAIEYDKVKAPILLRAQLTKREAKPGWVAFISVITLGIAPLIAPNVAVDTAIGCYRLVDYDFLYDINKAKKLNESLTVDKRYYSGDNFEIEIQAFELDFRYNLTAYKEEYSFYTQIMNEINPQQKIKLTCNSCIAPYNEKIIDVDFTAFRVAENKRIAAENNKRLAEEEMRKLEMEKIEKDRQAKELAEKNRQENKKKQKQKDKIDALKKECVELGFKPDTDKFKDCVVELM